MAGLNERYDSALLGILQNEGQIAKFLDTIYGFLYRKTDFYMIMKEKTAKMGFPEGVALKLSVGAFKKYEQLASKNEERRQKQAEMLKKQAEQAKKKQDTKPEKPECKSSETVKSAQSDKKETAAPEISQNEPATVAEQKTTQSGPEKAPIPASSASADPPKKEDGKSEQVTTSTGATISGDKKRNKSDDDDDNPELTKLQKQFQANPESYNGAARDNYSWSQSISDVDVQVQVPKWIRKGAEVKVQIEKKRLKALHREKSGGGFVTVLDGPLTWDINKEESMWSLVPGEHIHVNLEKIQERWWEALLEDEPKISVRKIDPSRPITDLDDEAQAKIEEMMYNERQKRLGLPQSHETKVHDMLKNAWDLEGSPFKGQPFDPSMVNIQNPGDFSMPGGGPPPGGST